MTRPPPHGAPPTDRVLLAVPYAEKDEAKAYGARWDPVLKTWWTTRPNLAANPALSRWVSDKKLAAKLKEAHDWQGKPNGKPRAKRPADKPQISDDAIYVTVASPVARTGPLPRCSCPVLPWEDCKHTMSNSANTSLL